MVKLVDAVDSKSTELLARAGSIPAFGTIIFQGENWQNCYKAVFYDVKGDLCFAENMLSRLRKHKSLANAQGYLQSPVYTKKIVNLEPVEV